MVDSPELAWETLDSETEYTCPGFEVVRDDVRLPDGTEIDYHYVTEAPSVVVLPFRPDGDVVVIEEWRQAVDRVSYGLPAGSLESDDADPLSAARRELTEETGYGAEDVEYVATYEPGNGLFDSVFHYVVARGCTPTTDQDLDHNESIRVDTTTFADLQERALAGNLRDGRSALGILHYALQADD